VSYPFAPAITYGEFKARAVRDFGCRIENATMRNVISGKEMTSEVIRRTDGAKRVVCDIGDQDRLAPTVLRSLCQGLNIPAECFGLELG